jgi:dolichyl-phosphate-mannose-protein mannosyltransferase
MSAGPIHTESVRRSLLAGLAFLCAILVIQWLVGAQRGEQGIYSDDAAHFMNGLLVRDYVAEGLGQNPVAFAKEYFVSYPKTAPAIWPPLFHVTLGFFLLPRWPPFAATLFLLGAVAAWAAWRLYRIVSLFSTRLTGLAVGILFVSTPMVVAMTTSVMVDAVVAAFAIEAIYWLAVFTRTEQRRHAAWFGLFTALCCLTKGNGVSLVFGPIAMVLLIGRADLLRRSGLYVWAAIVMVLAGPALFVTYLLDTAMGNVGPVTLQMVLTRLGFYSGHIWTQLGPVATLFAAIGLLSAISRGRRWQEDGPLPVAQALTALVVGSFVFHVFYPHLAASGRYLTLAIAPLYGLSAFGVQAASRFVAAPARRPAVHDALLGLLVVTTFFARPVLTERKPFGYGEVITHLQQRDSIAGKRMLVVSDEGGEGALVTDVAIRELNPRPVIVRGSKLLGTPAGNGDNSAMRYPTAQAIMGALEDLQIEYLLVDSSPDARRQPYWPLIKELVETHEEQVQIEFHNTVDRRSGPVRPLALYRVKSALPGPPKSVPIPLTRSTQRILNR